MTSNTPRCDAMEFKSPWCQAIHADLARQLELELNVARACLMRNCLTEPLRYLDEMHRAYQDEK